MKSRKFCEKNFYTEMSSLKKEILLKKSIDIQRLWLNNQYEMILKELIGPANLTKA